MNQLPEEIIEQINKEAEEYAFRVPYDGSKDFYNEDRLKGYQDGASPYALKWQQAEEKAAKLLNALKKIVDEGEKEGEV